MATGNINSRSQMKNIRFPHDVIEEMENSKTEGETIAAFVITAVRGEIARRKAEGSGENPLVSSLDALAKVEQIGIRAAEEIGQLVAVAREELQRRKAQES
ncbi:MULTISPECIES: YlcI/YnfO family protein [Escherichia]|uniref:YlcI/YnfO family protein n=1 Tax=Escherichia TaxID=561 RepID=UPI0006984931|nr:MULTISPECIES: YlcI/YnfO family protein [Escherichia]EFV9067812.1 hypothetical protein [Shigella sonnei]EFN9290018.1 hypothetical protein [Escherichia coli]EFW0026928.1 hypothetical protein [Shigella sonnei]EFW0061025.1 hypothetical protein [Shigella sonnei]EHP5986977.1 hypothetical protein [Escherichia coli]